MPRVRSSHKLSERSLEARSTHSAYPGLFAATYFRATAPGTSPHRFAALGQPLRPDRSSPIVVRIHQISGDALAFPALLEHMGPDREVCVGLGVARGLLVIPPRQFEHGLILSTLGRPKRSLRQLPSQNFAMDDRARSSTIAAAPGSMSLRWKVCPGSPLRTTGRDGSALHSANRPRGRPGTARWGIVTTTRSRARAASSTVDAVAPVSAASAARLPRPRELATRT